MSATPSRSYYLWNIGCQMNKADAWRLADALHQRGYRQIRAPDQAELMILNTCVVRQSAEDKVLGRLLSLKPYASEKGRDLLVMGCFVDDPQALRERYPFVAGFFAPSDLDGVLRHVDRRGNAQPSNTAESFSGRVAEMVPLSYGCDHHCTYCLVQLRRGAQRSRSIAEIRADCADLVARGAREITLLGQNVDAYGQDLPDATDLADVLEAVHEIPELVRIRFLTSHPRDLSLRLIETAARLPKVCESWELPVQSGDDLVLKRMGRGYTAEHYRELVEAIRTAMPQAAINTDMIVGFPGETLEQYERSLAMVRDLRFNAVHIAPYSERPGTAATVWEDDISSVEKELRYSEMDQLQTAIATERSAAFVDQEVEVLAETRQKGRWRGRTRGNQIVFFESREHCLGKLVRLRITWAGPWSMVGEFAGLIDSPSSAP